MGLEFLGSLVLVDSIQKFETLWLLFLLFSSFHLHCLEAKEVQPVRILSLRFLLKE